MDNLQEIFTDQIDIPLNNMRQVIDRDEIFELGQDIKKNGLISPITVRPIGTRFEVVAGQRRYLAHQVMGIIKIKCVVRELTDDEALAIMTSENLSRVDVNPLDEARHVARLMQSNNDDTKKVAELVSRGVKWVNDRLAVGQMPEYMQEFLAKKEIKLGVALQLAQITDESYRKMWVFQAVRDGVSTAMAEAWLAHFKSLLLPGGALAGGIGDGGVEAPPTAVLFPCAIDGKQYDTRLMKSLLIYEGNLLLFNEFVSAIRADPSETELELGGG